MQRNATSRMTKERGPNVRTGCATCKKRNVKCDEGKPICQRCKKGDYVCDGYQLVIAQSYRTETSAPQNGHPPSNDSSGTKVLMSLAACNDTHTPLEAAAFRFFLNKTAPAFSMWCEVTDFWPIVVPQFYWAFPQLRHLITAISLVDRHMSIYQVGSRNLEVQSMVLYHYNEAIKGLVNFQPELFCVLLCSTMAYKLENMHRRPRFAMIHLKAAQKLVHEAKTNDMGRFSDSKASAIGAIDEVVKMSLAHMEAVAAPQPTIHGSENIQFDSLDEARVYLEWFLVAKHGMLETGNSVRAFVYLNAFEKAYDEYCNSSREEMEHKRAIRDIYRMTVASLQLSTIDKIADNLEFWNLVLDRLEHLLAFEVVLRLQTCLKLLLSTVVRHCPESEQQLRATQLRSRMRDLS